MTSRIVCSTKFPHSIETNMPMQREEKNRFRYFKTNLFFLKIQFHISNNRMCWYINKANVNNKLLRRKKVDWDKHKNGIWISLVLFSKIIRQLVQNWLFLRNRKEYHMQKKARKLRHRNVVSWLICSNIKCVRQLLVFFLSN